MYFLCIKPKFISTTQQRPPKLGNSTDFHIISIHLVATCFEQNLKVPFFSLVWWYQKNYWKNKKGFFFLTLFASKIIWTEMDFKVPFNTNQCGILWIFARKIQANKLVGKIVTSCHAVWENLCFTSRLEEKSSLHSLAWQNPSFPFPTTFPQQGSLSFF